MTLYNYDVLFDCLLACANNLEALHVGVASDNGTINTLIDNQLPVLGYDADDIFNGGTIFFLVDALAMTNAVDKTRYITDYQSATGSIVFTPFLGSATGVNDKYGVMTARYPLYVMTEKINKVLREQDALIGVSIVADGGREYTVPGAALPYLSTTERIHRIMIGSPLSGAQNWRQALTWQYHAMHNRLLFKDNIASGDTIVVQFWTRRIRMDIDNAPLDIFFGSWPAHLNADWIGMSAAIECVRWHLSQPGADERSSTALLNDLMVRLRDLRKTHYGWRTDMASNVIGTFWPSG